MQLEQDLLSIVVPVYNTQAGLKKCIESILKQTYYKLELLLIDDGSTDESGRICDAYAQKDRRVRVFHIQNSGPAQARNIGLLHVRGQYLTFVDSDDYMDVDMYEYLIHIIKKEKVAMVICNWKKHLIGSEAIEQSDIGVYGKRSSENLRAIIASDDIKGGGGYPWNRVIDWQSVTEKLGDNTVVFPVNIRVYEDKVWILQILRFMKEVMLVCDAKYDYVIENGSLSNRCEEDKLEDLIQAWKLIEQEFDGRLPFSVIQARKTQMLHMLWSVTKAGNFKLVRSVWKECEDTVKGRFYEKKDWIKYLILKCVTIGCEKSYKK